ncbi:MAG: ABC-2 family transporter protein [Bacillota bacterium]
MSLDMNLNTIANRNPGKLGAWRAVFRLRLICCIQYRIPALAGVVTQLFWGIVSLLLYQAFYESCPTAAPMTFSELVNYIWVQQAFFALINIWCMEPELSGQIISGDIAYELCRPQNIFALWFSKMLASRLAATLLRALPVIGVALLLPAPYGMTFHGDGWTMLLFIVALSLAALLNTAIIMLAMALMFFAPTPAVFSAVAIVGDFLSGLIVPLPLLPDALQRIAYILPFRYGADLPFRIFTGNIAGCDAISGIGLQLLWLVLLVSAGKKVYQIALRKMVLQGG